MFHFGHGRLAVVRIHLRYLPYGQTPVDTALGCAIPRFSQFPDWHSEWCSELVNPPPYGRTAKRPSVKDLGARGKLVIVLFSLITMLGCGALDANTPAAQSNTGLTASSAVVDFGSIPVGTTQVRTNTITNNTTSPVVLTSAQIDQNEFKITGQKLPLTLAPGAHVTVQIAYSPQSGGTSQSKIVLASNVNRVFSVFTLRGTAMLASRLRLNPSLITFGGVQIGKTQTQSATLSNSGMLPVTVTRAAITGQGFTSDRTGLATHL